MIAFQSDVWNLRVRFQDDSEFLSRFDTCNQMLLWELVRGTGGGHGGHGVSSLGTKGKDRFMKIHLCNEKRAPGCLGYVGDHTT